MDSDFAPSQRPRDHTDSSEGDFGCRGIRIK